jgi:hypothetical protein
MNIRISHEEKGEREPAFVPFDKLRIASADKGKVNYTIALHQNSRNPEYPG